MQVSGLPHFQKLIHYFCLTGDEDHVVGPLPESESKSVSSLGSCSQDIHTRILGKKMACALNGCGYLGSRIYLGLHLWPTTNMISDR